MPKRSKSKAKAYTRKKKVTKTNRVSNVSTNTMEAAIYNSGVPRPLGRSIKTNHTYFERQITVSPSIGVPGTYVYSANGMYDPNITGTGTQPVGFDEMTALFDHYTVIYSKIIVDFHYQGTAGSSYVGVKLNDNAASITAPGQLIVGESSGTMVTEQKDHASITRSVAIGKFLGRPNVLNEDDLRGDVGSNPAEQCYWYLYNIPNGVDADVVAIVRIEYVSIWTEPRSLNLS